MDKILSENGGQSDERQKLVVKELEYQGYKYLWLY